MKLSKFFKHDFKKDSILDLYNRRNKQVYSEYSDGYWIKREFDNNDNMVHLEDSTGFWQKISYKDNIEVYSEDSTGLITGKKQKEIILDGVTYKLVKKEE